MTVEKQLEAIFPVFFCTKAALYRKILDRWLRSGHLPTGNLVRLFMEEGLVEESSLQGGANARHMPNLQKPVTALWIREALLILRETVLLARKEKATFKMLSERVQTITNVGPLLGMHMIHCLSLSGLIPERFAAGAMVDTGNNTGERLVKLGMKKTSFGYLLDRVCRTLDVIPAIGENLIYKFLQDEALRANNRSRKFYDAIYADQRILRWVKRSTPKLDTGQCEYHIMELCRPERNRTTFVRKLPPFDPTVLRFSKTTGRSVVEGVHESMELWWLETDTATKTKLSNVIIPITRNDPRKPSAKRKRRTLPKVAGPEEEQQQEEDFVVKDRIAYHLATMELRAKKRQCLREEQTSFADKRLITKSGFSLRHIHAAQKHPSIRPNKNWRLGDTKDTTHLLSLGVLQVDFDVFRAAQHAMHCAVLRDRKATRNLSSEEIRRSTLRIIPHKLFIGRRPCYTPVAELTLDNRPIAHERTLDSRSLLKQPFLRRAVIKHHGEKATLMGSVTERLPFPSEEKAKRAMAWSLCLENSTSAYWITRMLRRDEWTAVSGNPPLSECHCDHSNSPTPYYIILGDSQGNVAATLVSDSNKCWARLEPLSFAGKQWKKRTTRIKNHWTENTKVCSGNPYAVDGYVRMKADRRKKQQPVESSVVPAEVPPPHHKQPPCEDMIILSRIRTFCRSGQRTWGFTCMSV